MERGCFYCKRVESYGRGCFYCQIGESYGRGCFYCQMGQVLWKRLFLRPNGSSLMEWAVSTDKGLSFVEGDVSTAKWVESYGRGCFYIGFLLSNCPQVLKLFYEWPVKYCFDDLGIWLLGYMISSVVYIFYLEAIKYRWMSKCWILRESPPFTQFSTLYQS